jgi:HD-GYP domain-containing protein (c-di-GMP phosphodiesterase class II)
MNAKTNFFSVRHDLIQTEGPIPYDLYINSSIIKGKEKYVKLFSSGGVLSRDEVETFHKKYFHLFVPEEQRRVYLRSLIKSNVEVLQKTQFLKETALEYLHNIFDSDREFSTELLAKNIEACREVVESMIDVLDHQNIDSLRRLIANLSFHDFYTYDHSINVSMYCIQIYRVINRQATRRELMHAGLGGLLHDLGKIKVPTHILNKPEGLTDEEYQIVKSHPVHGLELLLNGRCEVSEDIDLKIIARVVHEHHENVDGNGYPKKLKNQDIHLLAKVCSIADFFDAITTKRAYSQVLSIQDAMNTMRKFKGTKLDANLFDIFDRHVSYVKAENPRDLRLSDSFDPTIPYAKLPIEEIESYEKEMDFGKIKLVEKSKKKG